MKRYILLALALSACSEGNRAQRQIDTTTIKAAEDTTAAVSAEESGIVLYTVPPPKVTGVDTIHSGDTTKYVYWTSSTKVDSTKVSVKPPPVVAGNKPFGGYNLLRSELEPNYAPFTGASDGVADQKWLTDALVHARDTKMKVVIAMPCGSHNVTRLGNCLVKVGGVATFSWKRFDSTLKSFATPTNVAAMQKAYNDGVVQGINSMDEPWVHGQGDGNTWGTNGLSRAQADTVCKKMKAAFPGVPVGLSDASTAIWEVTNYGGFKICDFGIAQFSYRMGDPTKWADAALALANKYGYMAMFSFNPINGGTQDKTGAWDCPGGFRGQREPNCMMTPAQIVNVVDKVGDRGCGVQLYWRWDDVRFDASGYKTAWSASAQKQASRAAKPCKRR